MNLCQPLLQKQVSYATRFQTSRQVTVLLHDQDNHDGVITYLEPDILECEVKQALESITTHKAGGGDGIQLRYFKS